MKSTLTAETLSLKEVAQSCFWLSKITDEKFGSKEQTTQTEYHSDSQSSFNAAYSVHHLAPFFNPLVPGVH